MTEEEKKEFEEFLQWKAEKAQREAEKKENSTELTDQTAPSEKSEDTTPDNQSNSYIWIVVGIFAVFILIVIAFSKSCDNKRNEALALSAADSTEILLEAERKTDSIMAEAEHKAMLSEGMERQWNFRKEMDEMTDSENVWASIISDNSKYLGSPYGQTFCRLTVRYMKKWGVDVLVQLTSGQIHGSKYSDENYVMVRFDDNQPIKYWFDEAADASSDCVFIRKTSDFIAHCKKAKTIKVEVPIFQAGRPVFTFELDSPLEWNR